MESNDIDRQVRFFTEAIYKMYLSNKRGANTSCRSIKKGGRKINDNKLFK